ncbi:MAG: family transporter [Acidimicrobiales bacterium]|jgi:predicted PurR-regulated permease PerM|nr:family transporter [Acidimicrobiales bacterium]
MPDQATERVPYRTIIATIALVIVAYALVKLSILLFRIEILLVVAAFFATVLNPPTEFVMRHARVRRGVAALLVFLTGAVLVGAMLYAFIRPIVHEGSKFGNNFSTYVDDAKAGRGTVGHVVKRYKLDDWVNRNKKNIQNSLQHVGTGALKAARSAAVVVAELLTVFVMAFMMIMYGPGMLEGGVGMLSPPTEKRVRAIGRDASRAITGYVFGNLLISVIAGMVTYVSLWILGVPFRGVLALFVGFADLIPLVGATLGAVPTIGVAFLHSTTAGIAMIAVYIVYQQIENHVIQPAIMAKTVAINQLVVLVAALIGAELLGLVGALLAIPAAGVIQVIVRDVYDERQRRLKPEPTVGADEIPVSHVEAGD